MKQILNNVRFLLVLLSILFFLSLTTGCWSSKEIESLSLVVGTALDKGEELTDKGEYQENTPITLTMQLVNPQAMGTGKQGGESQQKPYINVSDTEFSIKSASEEISLRREGIVFGQHQKLMVIGEDLIKEVSLQQLLDPLIRDRDTRDSCLVFIAKGKASKALESNETSVIPSFHLIEISENQQSTKTMPPMSLAKLTGIMQSESSFLLQNISSRNGEVKFEGAAIIKGKTKKLIGFFSKEELEGLTWITGNGKGGIVETFGQETGQPIVYEIASMKSFIQPRINGNNISFDVNIESEGRLSENWIVSGKLFENEILKNAEKAVEKEVKRLVENVVEKMQKEYEVDVAGFGNRLRIEHPKIWGEIKKDWDQTFSEVPIKYNINLTIQDDGV
ncbi:Ger(x)C family spore germination protein [Bacillus taeanensis]|uniref:Spore gernimation protein GerC n=1 Tax=Bacillus taeanensis TaxID=273032 RepID=A0A366XQ67_9BACI|nr:Ger(x)C family spore germination protein [Bacillus taeanensis]RBW68057.1 spore gernimation protein GerC [Bacillus taeanensis]